MRTLNFIYQENEIHFLVNPLDKNVMVNATEMAKIFDRRTKDYLKTKSTKEFISELERALIRDQSDFKIIEYRGHQGVFFTRILALDFAAWLDVKFRVWIFSTIDNIIFGNYKKHWEAHARQEIAKMEMDMLKKEILTNPTAKLVLNYFEQERVYNTAKHDKSKAIRNQLKLFDNKKLSI